MTPQVPDRIARLGAELRIPVTAALLVTGIVRLVLSVKASCDVLQCDDFGRFWYATSGWWHHGSSLYALTPASVADDGLVYLNLNLPHTHFLFLPFALVPIGLAASAWFLAGVACFAASGWIVARETGWRPTWTWLVVAIWWMPNHVQAVTGQLAWLLLLVIALSWAAGRQGRWLASGAWLGVGIAVKPFLLPMLAWMLWRRNVRAVLVAVAVIVCVVVLGVAVFGAEQYQAWRDTVSSVQWYARPLNASLWGMVFRMFTPNHLTAIVTDLSGAATRIALATSGVVALVTWWACRRIDDFDRQWTLVLAATLLICPLGWVYYGCLLIPGWRARWPGVFATACWLLPTPWLAWGQPSAFATVLWSSAATWGLGAAWWRAVRGA